MKLQNNVSMIQGQQEIIKTQKDQNIEDSFEKLLEDSKLHNDDKKLKEACMEMESYFIKQLYMIMRESTKLGEGIIPKGHHEEIFEDMLIEEQSKEASKAGGIGLADMLYRQLSRENAVKLKSPLE